MNRGTVIPVDLHRQLRLAHAHQQQGRRTEAADCYQSILDESPQCAAALHGLGLVKQMTGDSAGAVALLEKAVAAQPGNAQYRSNLAASLGSLGSHGEAQRQLEIVVERKPGDAQAWCNLGVAAEKQGKFIEAIEAYRRAIAFKSDYSQARSFLANANLGLGRAKFKARQFGAAISALSEAIEINPAMEEAHRRLIAAYVERGEIEPAIAGLRKCLSVCPSPSVHSALLYAMHYDSRCSSQELFAEHVMWSSRHAPRAVHDGTRSVPATRIRVGYVSPDFRAHTVTKFISSAIKHHDREKFEVFCYSNSAYEDETTRRLKSWADHWRQIERMSDADAAELIRRDGIDILVDLRGHGVKNRLTLFARKPAPIQVTMVGYFDTTGLPAMDYRITDGIQDAPGRSDERHVERLVRLPGSCWCYTHEYAPEVAEPPVLKNGYVTFGCLNKIVKVPRGCIRLWGRVLEGATGSKLLLVANGPDAITATLARFEREGIHPSRLTILDRAKDRHEYLARFNQIDICLDPFPFNGITTTCDGLWMGVPQISLSGDRSVSRAGKSLLTAAGMARWAARDGESYIRLAQQLAEDQAQLRELRMGMREQLANSPLMNERAFCLSLEGAFLQMTREGPMPHGWSGGSGETGNLSEIIVK